MNKCLDIKLSKVIFLNREMNKKTSYVRKSQ